MEEDSKLNPNKNLATAVVTGLLIVSLGLLSYRYFNKSPKPEIGSGTSTEQPFTIPEETNPSQENEIKPNQSVFTDLNAKSGNQSVAASMWVANDYKSGDVSGSQYVVKAGDTLWEIAEGRYGSGAEWTKILRANSSTIGFLSGGSQALIVPGQTLALP